MVMLLLAFLAVPMLVVGGASLLFAGGSGGKCASTAANAVQPGVSTEAANSIPSNYLKWFQRVGLQYNVPWTILAGIGKVESDDGRTTLPGVNSGSNSFGASPVSITFVVTINQQVTPTQPTGTSPSQQYAVTLVSSGGSWLVHDIELSKLGNT